MWLEATIHSDHLATPSHITVMMEPAVTESFLEIRFFSQDSRIKISLYNLVVRDAVALTKLNIDVEHVCICHPLPAELSPLGHHISRQLAVMDSVVSGTPTFKIGTTYFHQGSYFHQVGKLKSCLRG